MRIVAAVSMMRWAWACAWGDTGIICCGSLDIGSSVPCGCRLVLAGSRIAGRWRRCGRCLVRGPAHCEPGGEQTDDNYPDECDCEWQIDLRWVQTLAAGRACRAWRGALALDDDRALHPGMRLAV